MSDLKVNGKELGDVFGVSRAAISQMRQAGQLTADADGLYNLREAATAYIARLRGRGVGRPAAKSELEAEALRWKIENLKIQNRDWRLQRDRETVLAIMQSLATLMADMRRAISEGGNIQAALTRLADGITEIDPEDIIMRVEGAE